jgi:hypothetical protein
MTTKNNNSHSKFVKIGGDVNGDGVDDIINQSIIGSDLANSLTGIVYT